MNDSPEHPHPPTNEAPSSFDVHQWIADGFPKITSEQEALSFLEAFQGTELEFLAKHGNKAFTFAIIEATRTITVKFPNLAEASLSRPNNRLF